MKVLCIGYRSWALNIYQRLMEENTSHKISIINSKKAYDAININDYNPDIILYYGWSWIIDKKIINNYKCIMLHPSKLPKYRGGSPIQNQIISGENNSALTLFIMNEEIDAGEILFQKDMSLKGSVGDIFIRIESLGYEGSKLILDDNYSVIKQNESNATYCKRRTKEQSEITLDEIKNKSSRYLYDKVRMLTNPYPNAFIRCKDGKKLVIKLAEIVE